MNFGGGSQSNQYPKYTSIQLNVAVNTLPIPIFWGAAKLGTNLVEYVDFRAHKGDAGGKGGKNTTATYTATIQLALSEGLIDGIPLVLVNTNSQYALSDPQLKMSMTPGFWPLQQPWPYMAQAFPANSHPYPGTVIVNSENASLGDSAQAPNWSMLAIRQCLNTQGDNHFAASWYSPNQIQAVTYPKIAAAFPSGIPTADLALVIQDMLTSTQYGVPCFPSSSINTATLLSGSNATTTGDNALQTYLRALGLGYTPVLDSQETAQSILDRWMQVANCAAVWSGTSLKFIPYGDETITANGVTYLPSLATVYTFDDDDFLGDSSADPVEVTRTDFNDAYNVVRVEVTSADGFFAFVPVEARDQNAIEKAGGPRIMPNVTAHEICGTQAGAIIAQLILQQGLYWRNTAQFKLDLTMCLLEPMDIVALYDPNIGLLDTLYRVISTEEDDNGEITVTAQEFRLGTSTAQGYGQQSGNTQVPDQNQTASAVNTPVIFQPPLSRANPLAIWASVCGGGGTYDPLWGGCDVHLSTDDSNYENVGTINGQARMGTLTANLASFGGSNPDNAHTLFVDLSESQGTLETVSSGDAANSVTLCIVDSELLAFTTATLASLTATNEAHTVPAGAPLNVNVTHEATWLSDGGVIYTVGAIPLTLDGTFPTLTGHYYVDTGGLYYFALGDEGQAIEITYTYANSYHYALTGLYRGLYGTAAASHTTGAQFARLDAQTFELVLPQKFVGVTLYAKFVSFNVFNQGFEDISGLTPYTFTPPGIGTPASLTATPEFVIINSLSALSGLAILGACTAPADPGLVLRMQYQYPVSIGWQDFSPPPNQFSQQSGLLPVSGPYSVRARFETISGDNFGPWATTTAVIPNIAKIVLDTNGNPMRDTNGNFIIST